MIMFQIRRWGPKFSSKCSRLCWILSCLRTAGWHCLVFTWTLDSIKPVVRNQWSMSRPLLGLILLNEDYFQVVLWIQWKYFFNQTFFHQNLRDQVIASQQADKRAAMMTWSDSVSPPWNLFKTIFCRFENLMEGIERTLLTKNRDRFTQNLSVFRRDINDSLKGPNVATATSVNDMMTS